MEAKAEQKKEDKPQAPAETKPAEEQKATVVPPTEPAQPKEVPKEAPKEAPKEESKGEVKDDVKIEEVKKEEATGVKNEEEKKPGLDPTSLKEDQMRDLFEKYAYI